MEYLFPLAVGIFIASYALIISEKTHRTIIALTGAMVMIGLGVVTQEAAIKGIDFNTLGLLIGMMVVVTIAKDSGMFEFIAMWVSKLGRGKPAPIFILLGITVAIFSAFLDNVTTVLLMVPVIFVVANNLEVPPKPFLIGAILLSNIGGTATLIGDPPNILVGSAADLSFNDFLINLAPAALLVVVVTVGMLYWLYGRRMKSTPEAAARIMAFNPSSAISDWWLLKKSLLVLGLILIGFFTHGVTNLEGATIALSGAALLLLLTTDDPEPHLRNVEWTTIFFFIGLFILVAGLEAVGAIHLLADALVSVTGGQLAILTMATLWGSAVFSAIIDNIPFVATMIPLIKDVGVSTGLPLAPLWWALLLGADIGGNATLVGASANVVISGMAEKEGHRIGFGEYMKIAVPVTFVGLVVCSAYVYLRYLL
ncbi:hypothetical protein COV04_04255 [Candidatus Uhrbacteria bacterium CG10_big_fil_rev_8_21_14_0_10_48_11]|uniref:Citrate transporter-like domain-containing protein n=1 Tax=Candidatus Uhrbacteria bacterium CG10_big_fil_rev_8_21_14_0_10_48_11 TaxID=1975037 RepID=A0A2M8LDT7_9BACT|nr:MAG: hypothetical protein COV04_04255 [Candidatus Uhrbacteria bacterium CG10_big_fil_rev_8_21_14_0_10_48_11]